MWGEGNGALCSEPPEARRTTDKIFSKSRRLSCCGFRKWGAPTIPPHLPTCRLTCSKGCQTVWASSHCIPVTGSRSKGDHSWIMAWLLLDHQMQKAWSTWGVQPLVGQPLPAQKQSRPMSLQSLGVVWESLTSMAVLAAG